MKKSFVLIMFFSLNIWAQREPTPATPDPQVEGTIVKPTPAQKATVKEATKKVKKSKAAEINNKAKTTAETNPLQDDTALTPASTLTAEPAAEPVAETASKDSGSPFERSKEKNTDPHRFGLHVDLNVPHILNYGVDYWHSSRWFSGAVNFGGYSISGFAKSTDIPNGLNIKIANQELMLRMHPLNGSFYLGLGYGTHTLTVETKQTITVTTPVAGSADVEISDVIKANYLLPHIGWLWRWPMGLTFGIDLGYLSPISPTVDLKSKVSNISNGAITSADVEATNEYKNARRDLIDQSDKAGKAGLPYWTVFRIGWLF